MQGLSKYSDVFLRHEIDLKMFSYLTEDELKEIGINAFGKLYEKFGDYLVRRFGLSSGRKWIVSIPTSPFTCNLNNLYILD